MKIIIYTEKKIHISYFNNFAAQIIVYQIGSLFTHSNTHNTNAYTQMKMIFIMKNV